MASKKYDDLLKKVRAAVDKSATEFLENKFGGTDLSASSRENKIKQQVEQYLARAFDRMIGHAVGVEESYDRAYRVLYNSPLNRLIKDAADKHAEQLVREHLEREHQNIQAMLTAKLKVAIEKRFKESFEEEVLDKAAEYGTERAREEYVAIMNAAGIAPDNAPGKDKP